MGVLEAGAKLEQSRIRTVFGEEVPYSVRNVLLEGGRATISGNLKNTEQEEKSRNPDLTQIDAGSEFYIEILPAQK